MCTIVEWICHNKSIDILSLSGKQYMLLSSLPDNLVDEVVGVLSSEHSKSGPCWYTLLKANHLRVDREDRRLIYILNRDGDSCCGLKWRLDAAGKVGLVGHYHGQHESTVHLKIHRLERNRRDERERGERYIKQNDERWEDNECIWLQD